MAKLRANAAPVADPLAATTVPRQAAELAP